MLFQGRQMGSFTEQRLLLRIPVPSEKRAPGSSGSHRIPRALSAQVSLLAVAGVKLFPLSIPKLSTRPPASSPFPSLSGPQRKDGENNREVAGGAPEGFPKVCITHASPTTQYARTRIPRLVSSHAQASRANAAEEESPALSRSGCETFPSTMVSRSCVRCPARGNTSHPSTTVASRGSFRTTRPRDRRCDRRRSQIERVDLTTTSSVSALSHRCSRSDTRRRRATSTAATSTRGTTFPRAWRARSRTRSRSAPFCWPSSSSSSSVPPSLNSYSRSPGKGKSATRDWVGRWCGIGIRHPHRLAHPNFTFTHY